MKLLLKTHLIPFDGTEFSGEIPTDGLLDPATSPLFQFTGPMTYRLFCQLINDGFVVRGTLSAPGKAECSRCLTSFELTLSPKEELCLFYEKIPDKGVIDIGEEIREELLTLVPDYPLCAESCEGICPMCGSNRNETPCRCHLQGNEESPWDSLGTLTKPSA